MPERRIAKVLSFFLTSITWTNCGLVNGGTAENGDGNVGKTIRLITERQKVHVNKTHYTRQKAHVN